MMNKKVPRVFYNIWLAPTDPLSSHVRCLLCHQRHRSCTDYDLSNNRVKGGFAVNAEKIPITTAPGPKSNQFEVILADSILNVAPSEMGFHSLQPFLSATSKRPGSTKHWGSGSNCPSNWNWGRQPDFVGRIFFALVEGDSYPSQFNNGLGGLTWLKQNSFIWNPKNLR